MKIRSLLLLLFLIPSSPGWAAGCYTMQEVEAEQGLRIHSELMVIGLTCARMPGGAGLYKDYQNFTSENSDLIAAYESILMSFYKNEGESSPEKSLHDLRTQLANKISQDAVFMSVSSFCNRYASRIEQARGMSHKKIRLWARHVWPDQPLSRPFCAGRE